MKKKITLILSIICIICSCIACIQISGVEQKTEIKNLAYDFKKSADHMVYIKENGKYEAYFVLSNDYYGKTLLMRYYLLDEAKKFNIYEGNGACNAYYPNSLMDKFLSKDFYNSLSPKMKKIILDMDIDVATKESVKPEPVWDTEKIKRKIFLLSAYEIEKDEYSYLPDEGTILKYFSEVDDRTNRIGYYKNGETNLYWLRTPGKMREFNATAVSDYNGHIAYPQVDSKYAVRPVFCVEGNTLVFKKDIGDKKLGKVYVIE